MALPVVAMTTPCGNAPDVAIWYACTVPDMSERINNIENTAQHLFFCKSSQIFFTNIGLVHLCLTKILLLLSMQTYQTHFKRILQLLFLKSHLKINQDAHLRDIQCPFVNILIYSENYNVRSAVKKFCQSIQKLESLIQVLYKN